MSSTIVYDVLIVGMGPAGSTTAFYLNHLNNNNNSNEITKKTYQIAVLEKTPLVEKDKYCGDAWMGAALTILEEMGVLQDLQEKNLCRETLCGGFVSPSGYSFVADDSNALPEEKNMSTRTFAIKRKICDLAMARVAIKKGAICYENACVEDATLNEMTGIWTIKCADGRLFYGKFLVAADGAASNLSRKLGIVKDPPNATAARQYIQGGTHNFKADGVLLYPPYTVPGYMALFRHYDDSIDLGAYLLPGGPAKDEDIADIYSKTILTDPFVARALGPNWKPLERVKVASLRLGGVEQSFGERLLIVGDAAGHVDPLTGEGIHTAMIAGKIAAETLLKALQDEHFANNEKLGPYYHARCHEAFVKDFPMSGMAGKALAKFPWLMDAVPHAAAGKGSGKSATSFFADFGAVMTGVKPKTTFLLPWIATPLLKSSIVLFFKRILGRDRNYFLLDHDELDRPTSFAKTCFQDPLVSMPKAKSASALLDDALQEMFAWGSQPTPGKPPVLVAYGTEYGFSKQLANMLCQELFQDGKCTPRMIDLKNCSTKSLVQWSRERFFFVIVSTAGDGDPPVESRSFFEQVETLITVTDLHFAVLAPGDSGYPHFCAAGKELARKLSTISGCTHLSTTGACTTLDGDRLDPAKLWIQSIIKDFNLLIQKETSIVEWAKSQVYLDNNNNADYLVSSARANLIVDEPRATCTKPFTARLKSKTKLTTNPPCSELEDKWHIVIDISGSEDLLKYEPGDALGIVSMENDPKEIDRLLSKLHFSSSSSLTVDFIKLVLLRKNIKDVNDSTAKLLGINKSNNPNNRDIWLYDLLSIPPGEEQKINHTSIDPVQFIESLSNLAPRLYSIASSPILDKDEVHLCVGSVRYQSSRDQRSLVGVASTYLIDRLQIGSTVDVFVQRNPEFRLPAPQQQQSQESPKLMIGPGTGVAPFRAFWRHEMWQNTNNSTLYFGCKYEKGDFLYEEEMKSETFPYRVRTAFSRDQNTKVYVQHRIQQDSDIVLNVLTHPNGRIYICGDGWHMAGDVTKALVDILMKSSPSLTQQMAQDKIKSITKLDVWTV
jgi:sulfite reductase alpha subunit-like flavoprotein/flavin-dependent dehydrogenase